VLARILGEPGWISRTFTWWILQYCRKGRLNRLVPGTRGCVWWFVEWMSSWRTTGGLENTIPSENGGSSWSPAARRGEDDPIIGEVTMNLLTKP
jgi:hypothetical protein